MLSILYVCDIRSRQYTCVVCNPGHLACSAVLESSIRIRYQNLSVQMFSCVKWEVYHTKYYAIKQLNTTEYTQTVCTTKVLTDKLKNKPCRLVLTYQQTEFSLIVIRVLKPNLLIEPPIHLPHETDTLISGRSIYYLAAKQCRLRKLSADYLLTTLFT